MKKNLFGGFEPRFKLNSPKKISKVPENENEEQRAVRLEEQRKHNDAYLVINIKQLTFHSKYRRKYKKRPRKRRRKSKRKKMRRSRRRRKRKAKRKSSRSKKRS